MSASKSKTSNPTRGAIWATKGYYLSKAARRAEARYSRISAGLTRNASGSPKIERVMTDPQAKEGA